MANPKGNPQYLKKFQKGNPGGPGRPPKLPDLDKLMAKVLGTENEAGLTQGEEILQALHKKALKGDVRAAEVLLDRGYGKARQNVEIMASVDMNVDAKIEGLSTEDLLNLATLQSKISKIDSGKGTP